MGSHVWEHASNGDTLRVHERILTVEKDEIFPWPGHLICLVLHVQRRFSTLRATNLWARWYNMMLHND